MLNKSETAKLKKFFTKGLNQGDNSHAWYNTYLSGGKLSENGVQELQKYLNKTGGIYKIIIAHNVEGTRPQRTWGGMPSWARPESEWNAFDNTIHNNSFVFVIYSNMDGIIPPIGKELEITLSVFPKYTEEKDGLEATIKSFIKSFPEKAEVIVLSKEVENA